MVVGDGGDDQLVGRGGITQPFKLVGDLDRGPHELGGDPVRDEFAVGVGPSVPARLRRSRKRNRAFGGADAAHPQPVRLARAAIDDVSRRGRVPILVGGSGLYIRGALGDLNFPGTDPAVRERLEAELAAGGAAALHAGWPALTPAAAAAILPSNGRRIVRALEVIEISGRPFTATLPGYELSRLAVQIGVRVRRDELDRRIAGRVDAMWAGGFEDEVRRLERAGLRDGRTASRALGYAQMLRYLAGEWTLAQAREETARATRRFARRQESWFRRDPRITWLDAAAAGGSAATAAAGGSAATAAAVALRPRPAR